MAIKMNLLPPEFTAIKGIARLMKALKSLGVISVVLFFVFTIGLSAFYLISSASLRNLNSQVESLKSQITASQRTEQQSVLIKDRLTKIKNIRSQPNIGKNLTAVSPYVSGLSGSTTLSELSIDPSKVDFSLIFTSGADLSSFLDQLSKDINYSAITLTSFTFNPASGYSVGVRAVLK